MSAIVTALGGNASASIGDAVGQAMNLRLEQSIVCIDTECSSSTESIVIAEQLINQLNDKVLNLHALYNEIENSDDPNSYFDRESIEELRDADVMIRAFEEMLRVQYDGMVRKTGSSNPNSLAMAKKLRRTVAKLRNGVSALLSINNQLSSSELSTYQSKVEMTVAKVEMLKSASESAASSIH